MIEQLQKHHEHVHLLLTTVYLLYFFGMVHVCKLLKSVWSHHYDDSVLFSWVLEFGWINNLSAVDENPCTIAYYKISCSLLQWHLLIYNFWNQWPTAPFCLRTAWLF